MTHSLMPLICLLLCVFSSLASYASADVSRVEQQEVRVKEDKLGQSLLENYDTGKPFYYEGEKLEHMWARLHNEDSISYPSEQQLSGWLNTYQGHPYQDEIIPPKWQGQYPALAERVQESWRLHHAGQFKDAYALASDLGLAGLLPRLRSLAIHHHFFVDDKKRRRNAFAAIIREIEYLERRYNLEMPALYLLKAFCIGRYGQDLNPVNAFAKGLGGKLKKNIYKAAKLAPGNVEAMMFKAVFNAEVVAYVGGITGKILYGASRKQAFKYFDQALGLDQQNSALLLEYGKACIKLCKRQDRVNGYDVLEAITELPPAQISDVMNKKLAEKLLEQRRS